MLVIIYSLCEQSIEKLVGPDGFSALFASLTALVAKKLTRLAFLRRTVDLRSEELQLSLIRESEWA